MKVPIWLFAAVGFVVLTVVLVVLSRENIPAGGDDWFIVADDANDTLVLRWDGSVDRPMAQRLSAIFNEYEETASRLVVELNSPGGAVSEGDAVIRELSRISRTHRLVTRVNDGDECLSMCVPIYLQGEFRVAGRDSRWMFHEVALKDSVTGQQMYGYGTESRRSTLRIFFQYFEKSEMDAAWRERLAQQVRGQEIWKTGQELKDERSNIIMVLE